MRRTYDMDGDIDLAVICASLWALRCLIADEQYVLFAIWSRPYFISIRASLGTNAYALKITKIFLLMRFTRNYSLFLTLFWLSSTKYEEYYSTSDRYTSIWRCLSSIFGYWSLAGGAVAQSVKVFIISGYELTATIKMIMTSSQKPGPMFRITCLI